MKKLLNGERVRLNALTKDDLPAVAHWYENTEFLRLLDARDAYPQTAAKLSEWLDEHAKSTAAYLFGIRLRQDDRLIGFLELDEILWNQGTSWLGIGIGETDCQGQGYGHEAMTLALDFAFDELNLHRVQLTVFEYNERAIRLYEKLGFQREGSYREFLYRDGQRYDMYLYGLLRKEWEQNRKGM